MSQESDIAALIEVLEKVVDDCTASDCRGPQRAQVAHLIGHLKSGQADPELVAVLLAFNGSSIAQDGFRQAPNQRSTDSVEQRRSGLAARGMRLADDMFARLSLSQRAQLYRHRASDDSAPLLVAGRRN